MRLKTLYQVPTKQLIPSFPLQGVAGSDGLPGENGEPVSLSVTVKRQFHFIISDYKHPTFISMLLKKQPKLQYKPAT